MVRVRRGDLRRDDGRSRRFGGVGYHAGVPRGTTRHPVHLWALEPEVAEETTPVTRTSSTCSASPARRHPCRRSAELRYPISATAAEKPLPRRVGSSGDLSVSVAAVARPDQLLSRICPM